MKNLKESTGPGTTDRIWIWEHVGHEFNTQTHTHTNMFMGIKREDWKPSRQEKLAINMFLGINTKKSITKKK